MSGPVSLKSDSYSFMNASAASRSIRSSGVLTESESSIRSITTLLSAELVLVNLNPRILCS